MNVAPLRGQARVELPDKQIADQAVVGPAGVRALELHVGAAVVILLRTNNVVIHKDPKRLLIKYKGIHQDSK